MIHREVALWFNRVASVALGKPENTNDNRYLSYIYAESLVSEFGNEAIDKFSNYRIFQDIMIGLMRSKLSVYNGEKKHSNISVSIDDTSVRAAVIFYNGTISDKIGINNDNKIIDAIFVMNSRIPVNMVNEVYSMQVILYKDAKRIARNIMDISLPVNRFEDIVKRQITLSKRIAHYNEGNKLYFNITGYIYEIDYVANSIRMISSAVGSDVDKEQDEPEAYHTFIPYGVTQKVYDVMKGMNILSPVRMFRDKLEMNHIAGALAVLSKLYEYGAIQITS